MTKALMVMALVGTVFSGLVLGKVYAQTDTSSSTNTNGTGTTNGTNTTNSTDTTSTTQPSGAPQTGFGTL
jgi:hypothetical protein